jgi:hypothetical protein
VRSPYPNWDPAVEAPDGRLHGGLVLDRGHETPASSVRDAELEEVLEMPSDSPWPIVLAALVAAAFVMLLAQHAVVACAFFGLALLALAAWHWKEPE